MKKLILTIVAAAVLTMASVVCAGSITFSWDPSEGATGYTLFCGETMATLTTEFDVGNFLIYEITDLAVGTTYICRAKAYDANGNVSEISAGAFDEVRIQPPTEFKAK